MNRNFPVLRFFFSFSYFPFLMSAAICIVLFFSLSSCDTGSKGRYKFQAESMHWLQFRGLNASGIAPENADPPIHFNADTNLLWRTEMLPGWSSPCIVDDKIFLTGFNDTDSLLYTIAINRHTGEHLWKDPVKPHGFYEMHPVRTYAISTIASNGERIYAAFPNYGLVAYDLDGTKVWSYPHEILSDRNYGGASSPIIADSIVIYQVSSKNEGRIVGLDCMTGDSIWIIRKAGAYSCATPVIYDSLMIIHGKNSLVAYHLTKGNAIWWLDTPATGVATPLITNNMVYLNTWTRAGEKSTRGMQVPFEELLREFDINENNKIEINELPDDFIIFERPESPDIPNTSISFKKESIFKRTDADGDGAIVESEWDAVWKGKTRTIIEHGMLAVSLDGLGGRPVEAIKWIVNKDTPETPSPLIVNENIMFIKSGGIMTIINLETGEVFHKDRIGAAGLYLSSPLLAGNRIYTCSYNGIVTVLSADDFGVLAHNKLKEKIGASPVAVDDVLYVRTDKHLYAFRDQ